MDRESTNPHESPRIPLARYSWRFVWIRGWILLALFVAPALGQMERPRVGESKRIEPRSAARQVRRPPPPPPSKGTLFVLTNVEGSVVRLFATGGKGEPSLKETKTADDTGACVFEVAPGRYRVDTTYPEHAAEAKDVVVRAGEVESERIDLVPTFGYVTLVSRDLTADASIFLDGRPVPEANLSRDVDGWVRVKAEPGRHAVRVERKGRKTFEEKATVDAGYDKAIAVELPEPRVAIVVRSLPGARVYANDAFAGAVPASGGLQIENLAAGEPCALRVEFDDYRAATKTVTPELDSRLEVPVSLERLPTSVAFEELFYDLSRWSAPTGWSATNGVLTVGGPGLGMPLDKRYRDFEMAFSVRLQSRVGAAWMLRARDERNLFLVWLCGPESRWKNQLRVYDVRDGVFDPEKPAGPVTPLPFEPSARDTYRVDVRVADGRVRVWVTPASTAEKLSVGFFELPSDTPASGNMGFTTIEGAPFQVEGFFVKPLESAPAPK
jgi:hypothetical protein